jgi:CRISPR-associated protein (TIGR02584 family)
MNQIDVPTKNQSEYPRRILLVAAGLTPQVVTETFYALAVSAAQPWIPTEIWLATTREGAERARLTLLGNDQMWLKRLFDEYRLPPATFNLSIIVVLKDRGGQALDDIRSAEDNQYAADGITELIRELTQDDDVALHVSMAGGRKTIGFFLGYAISLYGRAQDRLSHVLVSPPFESHPGFFFPTRSSQVIYTAPPDSRPLDTSTAQVTLADIPFVRLRHGLPDSLLSGRTSFIEAVAAAQHSLGPPELVVDLIRKEARGGGVHLRLCPAELAFYMMFARRAVGAPELLACPPPEYGDALLADEYLRLYRIIVGDSTNDARTTHALRHGMDKDFFLQHKSRVHALLKEALGVQAELYRIHATGQRPNTKYGLRLRTDQIRIVT